MKTATGLAVIVIACLVHAMPASAQCRFIDFSPLLPHTRISLSPVMYSLLTSTDPNINPALANAVIGAHGAWNVTNAKGRLGDWTGVIPNSDAPECPAGQPPFRLSAFDFTNANAFTSCPTTNTYSRFGGVNPAGTVAFTDYHDYNYFLQNFSFSCPSCGTMSIIFNSSIMFSIDPNPMPGHWDVWSVLAHEFGHMLGLAHLWPNAACQSDQSQATRCGQPPGRNTMSNPVWDGEICERNITGYDKLSADTFYPPPPPMNRDFNGDGKADILWRNDSGAAAIWLMDGSTVIAGANLQNNGPTWHVAGVGDFNGDRKADIFWRHDSGLNAIWLMNGTDQLAGANLRTVDPSWKVAGLADFNGDGKADILWRNDNGGTALWLMDGFAELGGANLRTVDPSWKVAGLADFNGDGKADILWRNDSGATALWLMDGFAELGGVNLPMNDPAWKVAGLAISIPMARRTFCGATTVAPTRSGS